jgi:hypothetical protein
VIVEATVDRLYKLFTADNFPDDPLDRVTMGFVDFVLPFEKFEGHPKRKAVDGRWRIVTCLSLVDQLVERVLYTDFVRAVKDSYPHSGVVIGIGFTDDCAKEFASIIPKKGVYSTDISGMDRSLDATYVRACVKRRQDTLGSGFDSYKLAMSRHNECMLDPVFAVDTPTGRSKLFVGCKPKGMLSGRYVTTYFNSDIRVDMAHLAGADFVKATGDDCLERHEDGVNLISVYKELGFVLRDPVLLDGSMIEYCSHTYRESKGWKPALSSWPKALHKLCSRPVTSEYVDIFLHEVRHNTQYDEFKELLSLKGVLHLA